MAQLITIFTAIFLAELADKTQIATLLFAAEREASPLAIFIAFAGALTLSCAIAVVLGNYSGKWLHAIPVQLIAGFGLLPSAYGRCCGIIGRNRALRLRPQCDKCMTPGIGGVVFTSFFSGRNFPPENAVGDFS